MSVLERYLTAANAAVGIAEGIIRTGSEHAVAFAGGRHRVTPTDVAIERAMRVSLHHAAPEVGFLGEGARASGLAWVLDPIGGAVNFARGVPLSAISLALLHYSEPVIGMVSVPAEGVRYTAVNGLGANRDGTPIRVSDCTDLRSAIVAMGDFSAGRHAVERVAAGIRITAILAERARRVRMLGSSAVDLAWVASGRLDAAVLLSNEPRDAAGALVAREAGAIVTDLDGRSHGFASPATVAAAPGISDMLLATVRNPVRNRG